MDFTILGSGFGIYGYLPVLVAEGHEISLPERYRTVLEKRTELCTYINKIKWQENEDLLLDHVQGAVIAVNPFRQYEYLDRYLSNNSLKYLLLEKPLAPTPALAKDLLVKLNSSKINFLIGYLFRHTSWANELKQLLAHKENINICLQWLFNAHHFKNNIETWKRFHSQGGGVIRFYGIHIIALLAELGYDSALSSKAYFRNLDEYYEWSAIFTGYELPHIEVNINSASTTSAFNLITTQQNETMTHIKLPDPFSVKTKDSQNMDYRIPILQNHCHTLFADSPLRNQYHQDIIELWNDIEKNTHFIHKENEV